MTTKKKTKKVKKEVPSKLVHVTRSYSYKNNLGDYSNEEFFCSQTVECPAKDAGKMSEVVHQFCRSEVVKSLTLSKEQRLDKLKSRDNARLEAELDAE